MLAATAHLFFERHFEILDINFKVEGAAAEGVGDFDLLDVVDTKQVGYRVDDSFPKGGDKLLELLFMYVGVIFDDDL